ncbi:hypothetical protein [Streptomyces sp. G45]|uniref:hypothetical protein n=1 Tax=Streptomyces sp. G45 TaxID=3406627 RepID=UPI003C2909A6
MSAPAALATEGGTTTPGASANETPAPADKPADPGTPGAPEDPADPDAPANPDDPSRPNPGDPQKPGDKPGDPGTPGDPQKPSDGKPGEKPGGKPGEPGTPGDPGTDPDGKPGTEPGDKPGGKPGAKPGNGDGEDEGEEDPSLEPCEPDGDTDGDTDNDNDNDNGEDLGNDLELELDGLPGRIAAGSGWHEFTLTATNVGDDDLGEVNWLVAADNFSESEDEQDWLSTYARVQFYDPAAKGWKSIVDEAANGTYFDSTTLGASQQVELKLRLSISAKAPAGPGYALGFGGYVDEELECVHSSFSYFDFTVEKAGSSIDYPGEAVPLPDKPAPRPRPRPQGGIKPVSQAKDDTAPTSSTPPSGSLAQTGSSSMLPTLGIVGGAAVAVGAGTVYVVRRRGNSDATA